MRITVFTSNQPRHISLIESLAGISDEVYAVQECTTVFPGEVPDFFRRSDVMQEYFRRVMAAEAVVFGRPRLTPANVRSLAIKMGDLNKLGMGVPAEALQSDVYVVFGASWIKGALCDHLVAHRAYNIHMGVSPYYRGSSTNFWALYDGRPDYVGATIHLLTAGLDSGPMLFHALPKAEGVDPFLLGMKAVKSAHSGLVHAIASGSLAAMEAVPQDKTKQIRYTRNGDFTDAVAGEYLKRLATPEGIEAALAGRDMSTFLRSYVG